MRGKRGKRSKLLFVTNGIAANRHLWPFPILCGVAGACTCIRYIFFVVRCNQNGICRAEENNLPEILRNLQARLASRRLALATVPLVYVQYLKVMEDGAMEGVKGPGSS